MNRDEALDKLVELSDFFEVYAQQNYVPRAMEGTMATITEAYKVINPGHVCTTCGNEMIIDANRWRLHRIKELEEKKNLKHHTFPKH